MSGIGNVIKERRKELKLKQRDIASFANVSEGTVSRWESGEIQNMKMDKLSLLAQILNLPIDELLPQRECGAVPEEKVFKKGDDRKIPLVGTVACGLPILSEENIEDYVSLPDGIKADFCLLCHGDSMINARIMDGDVVFLKKSSEINNGDIAAVSINDETTLKRVYVYPDSMILCPENPSFAPIVVSGPDLASVRIEGIAVAFLSYIK